MEHLSHLYPPQLPKGRGRPRATYAQTGEFDLGLIREYRSHPVLYDRTNKRFKDKLYVAQIWDQMAHKLGYDATSLRERMTTLRNRYNIEKRRVENGLSTQASQWPLFESLQFLGDHIRPRRSFKNMSMKEEDEEPYEVDDCQSDSNGQMTSVKDELDEDCEIFDCEQALPVTTVLGIPLNTSDEANKSQRSMNGEMANGKGYNHYAESYQRRHQNQPEYIISSPIINHPNKFKRGAQLSDDHPSKRRADDSLSISAFYPTPTPTPLPPAYAKFRGFGEFMCHSLCDMPAPTALRLVQKFTRELVQTSIRSEGSGSKRMPDQVDPVDQSSESQEEDE
ncbi:uncharacterized protein LOC108046816 [Drosophila rhopaloa]|uniref:Uncharacterized protein LOC108046816 n=1 Tax=Drosophila rhopaloa TaxID=1041015 RepID=A0A6P4F9U0_DRORH|nr:uncharacterized protein LOC108046816 [Drosophila rhopaloa]XP_016982215.1 uncharacterized protein LOC108046816 [Drosophila rhopaloa]XP_016982216.1 uncharacterized protein LOC108046816 [Drosophila rhopaloa]XP_016982217.1 uncharacterized protein LOC108046816 [Drosophila rhopaloa]XP_044314472.1 uncharacterized protein LOC108046816 [Drosophila rhopaloa]